MKLEARNSNEWPPLQRVHSLAFAWDEEGDFEFRHSQFFLVSDFGIRISLLTHLGLARGVKPPPGCPAFLHHVDEIILPDDEILIVVLDDRTLQAGGEVIVAHRAVAKIARERHTVGEQRNGLGGREHTRGRLHLVLAVERLARAEFAEDGYNLDD